MIYSVLWRREGKARWKEREEISYWVNITVEGGKLERRERRVIGNCWRRILEEKW